ncbi:reverse transcriptase domain-containing protein [Nocardia pseudovaccinii]|uniref:reverse transcriptase domain-containing protein n=1 Tax=Nocardia pseudovaccinii TaxID=189540 RepID=UPI003D8C8EAC
MLVRFADDAVVMCRSRQQAEAVLARLTVLLAELGLEAKPAKTRIVHLRKGGEGLDFLGFHHRWVCAEGRTGGKGVAFLARWPADKAMQHARNRIRDMTVRRRTLLRVEHIVEEVNRFLRGWAGYFPVRELVPALRQDQKLRADANREVHRQEASAQPRLRVVGDLVCQRQ